MRRKKFLINYVFVIISYIYNTSETTLPMQPDATIMSILDRYENNEPVTVEEKAILHKWLVKSLRVRETLLTGDQAGPTTNRFVRKKVVFWHYVFIILMLFAVAFTLFLFAISTGKPSIKKPHDNVHGNHQQVRTAG
jgi:hypothetical protein